MSKKDNDIFDEQIAPLAYDMEEAFLEALKKHGDSVNPLMAISSLGMATGHILQTLGKAIGNKEDLKDLFREMQEVSYDYFSKHPSDSFDIQMPKGSC